MIKSDWLVGVEVQIASACGDWHGVVALLEDHGQYQAANLVRDAIESEQVAVNEHVKHGDDR